MCTYVYVCACVCMCVCARTPPLVQSICYRFLCVARHDLDDFTTVTAFEKHREFMVGTRVPRLHLDSPTPPAIRDQVVSASFYRRALGGLDACALSKWHYRLTSPTASPISIVSLTCTPRVCAICPKQTPTVTTTSTLHAQHTQDSAQ